MIFVLPGDIDDPELPSGGNVYDRRIVAGLRQLGRPVREVAVPGAWPSPGAGARALLDRELAAVPAGALVVIDGLVACGVPEVVVPHAARLRLVVLVHMPLGDETGAAAALDARERTTLHAARAVVTMSAGTARRLRRHHGLSRVHVVPPGTDPAPVSAGSELLCVASLTPHKGQDTLVEALAAVADLDWRCRLVGPLRRAPSFAARVRELIARHDLTSRVVVTGPLTGPALDRAYERAGLLVLPSRSETYGMVVAEALARGIPVLASAGAEALGRAADGSLPGILVPPGDVPALAGALRSWLTSPSLRGSLRRSARLRRGALPDWTTAARTMDRVLGELEPPPPG
ncbi:glycosyltransferase family 4 protein [Amycolatopsis thermophila]|uniref:Glycosyltransferase involved in cell wall biosynthesis n=1 Tax=Amycolatopsis thermophila TaxID=206084 RepID=A0ABU0F1R3_9PSEU|nr:glycosyltransferase family 4 protein [Amycolatopsis thermophila]MDQ0380977.1 glycosyltransferase involved in cell wall biosynthesis [Amycolatopsis thermophila]